MIDLETMELTELGKEVCTWIGAGITIILCTSIIVAVIIILIKIIKWVDKKTKK